jgi:hypothetical protein
MGREEGGLGREWGLLGHGPGGAWAPAVGGARQGEGRERRGLREGYDLAVEKMRNEERNNGVCSPEKTKFAGAEKKSVD